MSISNNDHNFTPEEIKYIRIDWEYKQVINNIQIQTKQDMDTAYAVIKDWFHKDEVKYIV